MSNLKNLNKNDLQKKCAELDIDFIEDETKAQLIEKIEADPNWNDVEDVEDANFDRESYDTFVRLTFEKGLRKGGKLKADEVKTLAEVKPKAFKNVGKKPLKTNSYRVNMKSVQLIEGLPTPADVVNEFSKEGQAKLFI